MTSPTTYVATHLASGESFDRPFVLRNPHLKQDRSWPKPNQQAEELHQTLPNYAETRLHELPSVAADLGVGRLFVKDESTRFGMPAFKVLGASYAVHKAVCQKINSDQPSVQGLIRALKSYQGSVEIVTCTAGNWGRAVARTATLLGVTARVYVPGWMHPGTQDFIRGEGADLRVIEGGSYDDALAAVQRDAASTGALMIQDVSWEGYDQIPSWCVDGYITMLREADRQITSLTGSDHVDVVVASLGAGTWAQAVVAHYKHANPRVKIVIAEPDTASCFKESLHVGDNVSIVTGDTIMAGMNGGTTSATAWPILRDGIDLAVVVTDLECHQDVVYLQKQDVNAGPCGAATLTAMRKVIHGQALLDQDKHVVLLLSTEGNRTYKVPESKP